MADTQDGQRGDASDIRRRETGSKSREERTDTPESHGETHRQNRSREANRDKPGNQDENPSDIRKRETGSKGDEGRDEKG